MTISSLTSANVSATYAAAANAAKATVTNVAAAAPKASASAVTVSISSAGRAAAAAAAVTYTDMQTFNTDLGASGDASGPKGVASALTETYDLKISTTDLTTSANLTKLKAAVAAGKITSITLSDPTTAIELSQTTAATKLETGNDLANVLAKITSKHTIQLTNTKAVDVASIKKTSASETLSIQVKDTLTELKANAAALQTAAKAGTLTKVEFTAAVSADANAWSMTGTEYSKTYGDLTKVIQTTGSVIVTGASVGEYQSIKGTKLADATKTLFTQNIRKLDIIDKAATVVAAKATLTTDLAANTKITGVKISDSIANLLKAGDVKGAAAAITKTTIVANDTKPFAVSVSNALKLNAIGQTDAEGLAMLAKASINDTVVNIIGQKRDEIKKDYTGTKVVLANVSSVTLTDKNLSASVADIKTLTSIAKVDQTKLKYTVSDTFTNIDAAKTDNSVKKASGLSFKTSITIDQANALSSFTQVPVSGSLIISDTAAKIAGTSLTTLDGLISKGFSINISDTTANFASKFSEIDARVDRVTNINLDDNGDPTDTDAEFASTVDLTKHTITLGHVVTDYTQAS